MTQQVAEQFRQENRRQWERELGRRMSRAVKNLQRLLEIRFVFRLQLQAALSGGFFFGPSGACAPC
jgi:hypothetical protein